MTSLLAHEIELEPQFYEIDPMQVVWHGHYVKFLEKARNALLAQFEIGYAQMRDWGYAFPVIELFIRYAQPLRLGQRIRVRAQIVEWESRVKTTYEIRDCASGRRLTKAHTVQVAVDAVSGELCYVCPKVLWEKLGVEVP